MNAYQRYLERQRREAEAFDRWLRNRRRRYERRYQLTRGSGKRGAPRGFITRVRRLLRRIFTIILRRGT